MFSYIFSTIISFENKFQIRIFINLLSVLNKTENYVLTKFCTFIHIFILNSLDDNFEKISKAALCLN